MNLPKFKQAGLSMIELMISITIGLIVVSGVIGMFVSTAVSSAENLKMTRLNQELRAVMDVMVRDIRRAGYRSDAATATTTANPFTSTVDGNDLTVNVASDCIAFTYDANNVPEVQDLDRFGFRRDAVGGISARNPGSAGVTGCATGTWSPITDDSATEITALVFTILPNPLVQVPITGTAPPLSRVVRNVSISLTGQVRNSNPVVIRSITETVRIQNDAVR